MDSTEIAETRKCGPGVRISVIFICLLGIGLFALRLAAPPNILDQDQERPAAYVLDIVKNGNWVCQKDNLGDIMSKPPVWSWLSAVPTLIAGRINLFTLYLPGALGALGSALLVYFAGRKPFGERAALIAATAVMLCGAGVKAFGLARTDSVFMFTVAATAFLAWRAWTTGRGWTWFWLMAAISTLTKGPLGLLLGGLGLVAALWEKKSGTPLPLRGNQIPGVALYFLITAGWLGLAVFLYGDAVTAKMIGKELVAQSVGAKTRFPGSMLYRPPLFYLARALPWSLAAYAGAWLTWKRPAPNPDERRFERYLFCWFIGGLIVFGLGSHQRADLMWPLIPAGALLAGRFCAAWTGRFSATVFFRGLACLSVLLAVGYGLYYFGPRAGRNPLVSRTVALKKMAAKIETAGGSEFPLTHVDEPMTLQFYLNTMRSRVSFDDAARLLRRPAPVFLVVSNLAGLNAARTASDPPYYVLLTDSTPPKPILTRIISNQPRLDASDGFGLQFGSFYVEGRKARLVSATEREFRAAANGEGAEILVTNQSSHEAKARICMEGGRGTKAFERVVLPNETWSVTVP